MATDYIKTTWEIRTYDVWGNEREGYEVNDSYSHGSVDLRLRVEVYNLGTSYEFVTSSPTDSQIRKVFGIPRVRLSLDGDDMTIYVNRARDLYPIGEMRCTSHESLSPIRESA